jgi:hypothetical protein
MRQFHELHMRLAGVYPGGPAVSIDKLEWAHQQAMKALGFNPKVSLFRGGSGLG